MSDEEQLVYKLQSALAELRSEINSDYRECFDLIGLVDEAEHLANALRQRLANRISADRPAFGVRGNH